MNQFRNRLSMLPFVGENEDGNLNMWHVTPSGDYCHDFAWGRSHAAILLHFMRKHDSPQVLGHIVHAMARGDDNSDAMRLGFMAEFCDAIMAVDVSKSTQFVMVSHRRFAPGDLRGGFLSIPGFEETEDGGLRMRPTTGTSDYSTDLAKGRLIGLLLVKMIIDTQDANVLIRFADLSFETGGEPTEPSGVRVAAAHVVAEVAIESCAKATVYQRAMMPLWMEKAADSVPRLVG